MTKPEVQEPQRTAITAQGCLVATMVTIIVAAAAVAYLHFAFDAFLVIEGADCEGCFHRRRKCAGVVIQRDMRDGEEARCLGIPRGEWRCYRLVHEEYVREPCTP